MSKGRLIFDLQKWFWMDVLITSTYGRLLDDLDRRHKNFHFQTILSWSHNVYDKPPTDVIWRFFAHWDTFSKCANHQARHQDTHQVGCQPGDCIWSL